MNWYVLFVKTGHEQKAVAEIGNTWNLCGIKVFTPMYDAKFRKQGRVLTEKRRLFPGYVFIESQLAGTDFHLATRPFVTTSQHALKLLRYGKNYESDLSFEMKNTEQQTFRELYNQNYCIDMSKGIIEGDEIKIIEGPLVNQVSRIKKINRHKMEATIELVMMGEARNVTVGLEIIEKLPKGSC